MRVAIAASWKFAEKVATLVGLVTPAFAIAYYVFALESRIGKLEAQLQVLAVSPAITREVGSQVGSSERTISNPIQQTCRDLTLKEADSYQKNDAYAALSIREMFTRLGCPSL